MNAFIDEHRARCGVEPICSALQVAPSAYRRYAARQRNPALLTARARRDAILLPQVQRVYGQNLQVYGADKVWRQLRREGTAVARCTVERLMRLCGLSGARRGKKVRTTVPDVKAARPLDRVKRHFKADRPNQLWVADFTLYLGGVANSFRHTRWGQHGLHVRPRAWDVDVAPTSPSRQSEIGR